MVSWVDMISFYIRISDSNDYNVDYKDKYSELDVAVWGINFDRPYYSSSNFCYSTISDSSFYGN